MVEEELDELGLWLARIDANLVADRWNFGISKYICSDQSVEIR